MQKKVIISACLLGEYCRYDGKTKAVNEVIEAFKGYEIIPFCPEAPLFGTPRERINVVMFDEEQKIITDATKKDVTLQLEEEILSFIEKNKDIDAIVLKSKSPSCGNATTPIQNIDGEIIEYGDGIACKIFKTKYKNIPLLDENNFSTFLL